MDDMDRVQELNEQFLDNALANFRLRSKTNPPGERSRTHCQDCEEPIPEARRRAMPGCHRCIDCQTLHENWRAL